MSQDEEFALIVVFANLVSAGWSYFCITASIDLTSSAYELMHGSNFAWYALWYSCQTFAIMVSLTNVVLLSYIAYRVKDSFVDIFISTPSKSQKALVGLVGTALALGLLPLSFVPFKMTQIQTNRMDENVFIHWDA